MAPEQDLEEILDLIGDASTRNILAAVSEQPQSAKELADRLGYSLPTVYRRINVLRDYDLVKERTLVAEDGNHYKVFDCRFNSALVELRDERYDVSVNREEYLSDRFSELWDELGGQ